MAMFKEDRVKRKLKAKQRDIYTLNLAMVLNCTGNRLLENIILAFSSILPCHRAKDIVKRERRRKYFRI